MGLNISETLSEVAAAQGHKIGIVEAQSGRKMSFAELNTSAKHYASYLHENGVEAGDRVMLMVKPSADFISLTFGLFHIGAPVILIDPGMGYKNLLRCIAKVQPDYMIGMPQAIFFKKLFHNSFKSVRKSFSCGSWFNITGKDIRKEAQRSSRDVEVYAPKDESLAAIIFTTGSTGPPKGVRFEHSIFSSQLQYIKNYYGISADDVDLPGFPLFALFSTALGACAIIPDMDPTKPAQVNPMKFVNAIKTYGVTYSFGSPAIWHVVSNYCAQKKITCKTLKKVLMAGAPVPGNLIKRVYGLMPEGGQIYTPYGATESLPIVSIEGREIINHTWSKTAKGHGTCVGRALPGIEVEIIEVSEQPFTSYDRCMKKPVNEIGEIIVKGKVVSKAYENNESETTLSKIPDKVGFWHRIGDMGYLDDQGRLWFCGRKAHRVHTQSGFMHTIPCEAIINEHPHVYRSALVGIDTSDGFEEPAIIVEREPGAELGHKELLAEIKQLAAAHPLTQAVKYFLIHSSFPVDIRHNAKIFREKLKIWAQDKIGERK